MLGSLIRFGALSAAGYGIFSALHHYSSTRNADAGTSDAGTPGTADDTAGDTTNPVALNPGFPASAGSTMTSAN